MKVWRRTLVANTPNRDWFAVWRRSGGLEPGSVFLRSAAGVVVPLRSFRVRPTTWIDEKHMLCFQVAPFATPGVYSLFVEGMPYGSIEIVPLGSPRVPTVVDGGNFGPYPMEVKDPDSLYLRTTFNRTAVFASGGMFLDCEFRGLATPGIGNTHSFSTWGGSGALALVGCAFRGCGRGPVIQLGPAGPLTELLMTGITVTETYNIDNGNELLCLETRRGEAGQILYPQSKLIDPIIDNWHCHANEGDMYFGAPVINPLIRNVYLQTGNMVFYKDSLRGGNIEGCELHRGRIVPGECSGLKVRRVALLDRRAVRGNRTMTQPFFYDRDLNPTEADVYNLPDGITANGPYQNGRADVQECYFEK